MLGRFYDDSPILLFLESPHGDDKVTFIEYQEWYHSVLSHPWLEPSVSQHALPFRTMTEHSNLVPRRWFLAFFQQLPSQPPN